MFSSNIHLGYEDPSARGFVSPIDAMYNNLNERINASADRAIDIHLIGDGKFYDDWAKPYEDDVERMIAENRDLFVTKKALDAANKSEGSVDYYPELRKVLNSDVVIHSARNPRRERMAGNAIAAALGLVGGGAAVAGYNALNQAEQY